MLITNNRKAHYDNEILEKFTAGLKLTGYEAKAVREKKVNMDGSYVALIKGTPQLINMHIGKYSKQSQKLDESQTRRTRQLLLTKPEILKLYRHLAEKGKTAIPLALVTHHNMIKLELGLAKGRKKAAKKHLEKERQIKKDLQKTVKENFKWR